MSAAFYVATLLCIERNITAAQRSQFNIVLETGSLEKQPKKILAKAFNAPNSANRDQSLVQVCKWKIESDLLSVLWSRHLMGTFWFTFSSK